MNVGKVRLPAALSVGLICILVTCDLPPVWSFGLAAHRQLVQDAADMSPPDLRKFLMDNMDAVREGSELPDTFFEDWKNQVYYPESDQGGNAPTHVKEELSRLVEMLEYGKLPPRKVARKFGTLSHYAADVYSPGGVSRRVNDQDVLKLENLWDQYLEKAASTGVGYVVSLDGFDVVDDPAAAIREAATWTATSYQDEDFFEQSYGRAVNLVVDLWITAWQSAGNSVPTQLASADVKQQVRSAPEPTPTPTPKTPTSVAEIAKKAREDQKRDEDEHGSMGSGQYVVGGSTDGKASKSSSTDSHIKERFGDASETYLRVTSWDHHRDPSGKRIVVEGEVLNAGTAKAANVRVRIVGKDDSGTTVAAQDAPTTPSEISPRQSSTFETSLEASQEIESIDVEKVLWD